MKSVKIINLLPFLSENLFTRISKSEMKYVKTEVW